MQVGNKIIDITLLLDDDKSVSVDSMFDDTENETFDIAEAIEVEAEGTLYALKPGRLLVVEVEYQ